MLLLLITVLSMIGQQGGKGEEESSLNQYIEIKKKEAVEEFNKMLLPDSLVPIFKVSNRFQGSSIFKYQGYNITVPISVSMIDMQVLRYTRGFMLLRFFVATPMHVNPLAQQLENPFTQTLNNTSVGLAFGGGWHVYNSFTALKPTGVKVSIAILGFWYIGVANSTVENFNKDSNSGLELNFRVEHFIKRNFAFLYGFDVGFGVLTHRDEEF